MAQNFQSGILQKKKVHRDDEIQEQKSTNRREGKPKENVLLKSTMVTGITAKELIPQPHCCFLISLCVCVCISVWRCRHSFSSEVLWRSRSDASVTWFLHVILYSLNLFPLYLFTFHKCTNFSTCLKRQNVYAIFQEFSNFPSKFLSTQVILPTNWKCA